MLISVFDDSAYCNKKMAYCVGFVNVAKIFSTGTTIKRTVDCGKCQ